MTKNVLLDRYQDIMREPLDQVYNVTMFLTKATRIDTFKQVRSM